MMLLSYRRKQVIEDYHLFIQIDITTKIHKKFS
jgi:hypothetical protein